MPAEPASVNDARYRVLRTAGAAAPVQINERIAGAGTHQPDAAASDRKHRRRKIHHGLSLEIREASVKNPSVSSSAQADDPVCAGFNTERKCRVYWMPAFAGMTGSKQ